VKVEFLESGSDDCPLIRIYGGKPDVFQQVRRAFEQLAHGDVEEVSLTDLPGIQPLGGCCLIAQASRRDRGIVRSAGNVFHWALTPATWNNVASLIEPFCCSSACGYQWLEQAPVSEVRVLVSTDGCW
jgi:hypothetical protein